MKTRFGNCCNAVVFFGLNIRKNEHRSDCDTNVCALIKVARSTAGKTDGENKLLNSSQRK